MGDVININGAAYDPDVMLEQAIGDYGSAILIGWDKDSKLDVRASTDLDHANILWLVELFKSKLVGGDYGDQHE